MDSAHACPACGHGTEPGQRFCRGCGGELNAPLPPPAPPLVLAPPSVGRSGHLFIGLFLVAVFALLTRVTMPGSSNDLRERCLGEMDTVRVAVGRYLARNAVPGSCDIKSLRAEGYLDREPVCPADGRYTIRVTQRRGVPVPPSAPLSSRLDVDVGCSVHGFLSKRGAP